MKTEEIKLGDWLRILMGDTPPVFLFELVLRTIFLFALLIVSMRLIGNRMAAQISRMEMVALFSLAAAIGVPLHSPDRGLLPAFIIAGVVVGVGRLLAVLVLKNERFEATVNDRLTILVSDGVVNTNAFLETGLTIERVFAHLRSEGIRQLGEVQRLYIEAGGSFSLVKQPQPPAGLSVLPSFDEAFLATQTQCDQQVCGHCGHNKPAHHAGSCPNCNQTNWLPAVQ